MRPRLSASGLSRAEECPASTVLPGVRTDPGPEAVRGTQIHRYLELFKLGLSTEEISAQYQAECSKIRVPSHIMVDTIRPEVAFALSPDMVARELGRGLSREYKIADDETPGTADLAGRLGNGQLYVGDWKTGKEWHVVDPKENLQLAFLGGCAAGVYGETSVLVELLFIREDGSVCCRGEVLDAFDLAHAHKRIKSIIARCYADDAAQHIKEGGWCQFCPAWNSCPAKISTLTALVTDPQAEASGATMYLTKENFPKAYARWRAIEDVMKHVRAQFHGFVSEYGPQQVADGKYYGVRETQKRIIDADKAKGIAPPEAFKYSISQEGIKKLLGSGKSFKEVMEKLDAAGAVSVSRSTTTDEYSVKEE